MRICRIWVGVAVLSLSLSTVASAESVPEGYVNGTPFYSLFNRKIEARKKGNQGCCSRHRGVLKCVKRRGQRTGKLQCKDRTMSPTCRC